MIDRDEVAEGLGPHRITMLLREGATRPIGADISLDPPGTQTTGGRSWSRSTRKLRNAWSRAPIFWAAASDVSLISNAPLKRLGRRYRNGTPNTFVVAG